MPTSYKKYFFSSDLSVVSLRTAFEARYGKDFYFKGEYHDFWEVVYVMSDRVAVSADERVFNLSEGDIIFHKPLEFHRLWAIEDCKPHLFVFSFDLSGSAGAGLCDKVFHLSRARRDELQDIIRCFHEEFALSPGNREGMLSFLSKWDEKSLSTRVIKNKIELFLLGILAGDIAPREPYTSRSADIYRELVGCLERSVFSTLSVKELAAGMSFSEPYIKKVFAKYSDCGIHEYFIKLKIKKAVELLENGCSVAEVSEKLHFANPNYFGVVFKREMGTSPSGYLKTSLRASSEKNIPDDEEDGNEFP